MERRRVDAAVRGARGGFTLVEVVVAMMIFAMIATGFLSSHVLDRRDLRDSIRRGQIAARFTCAQKASSASLITPEQMERYVNPW